MQCQFQSCPRTLLDDCRVDIVIQTGIHCEGIKHHRRCRRAHRCPRPHNVCVGALVVIVFIPFIAVVLYGGAVGEGERVMGKDGLVEGEGGTGAGMGWSCRRHRINSFTADWTGYTYRSPKGKRGGKASKQK